MILFTWLALPSPLLNLPLGWVTISGNDERKMHLVKAHNLHHYTRFQHVKTTNTLPF